MPSTIAKQNNLIPLYSLFAANAICLIGNVITMIAIPWFVLQTTSSATQTGIIGFSTILPVVLAGFFGGTFIDRLRFKRTSILSDLASGATTAMIPLLHFTVGLELWQLMVLIFLGAPLAGLLISILGTANVLWLDAASFLVSAGIIWAFVPQIKAYEEREAGNYLNELKDGLRFIRRDPLILTLVIMLMLTNGLDALFGGVLQPV